MLHAKGPVESCKGGRCKLSMLYLCMYYNIIVYYVYIYITFIIIYIVCIYVYIYIYIYIYCKFQDSSKSKRDTAGGAPVNCQCVLSYSKVI